MKQTKMLRSRFALSALSLVCCAASLFVQTLFVQTLFVQTVFAQTTPAQTTPEPQLSTRDAATQQAAAASGSFDQVIDRTVEREHFFMAEMKHLHPLVETYLQNLKQDKDIDAPVPTSDVYFLGRIWIEDQGFNIVRFNGTYYPHPRASYYLHFDSWRQNLRPGGVWLPSLIYSEESDLKYRLGQTLDYKAQTRLWGYNLKDLRRNSEFTEITVDAPQSVQDQSQKAQDATPLEAQHAWERQAEINVLDRLQQIGLIAPEGEIDKVLQTVLNNVMVTNNLDIQPDVRCRVLMTTPLESFTIGHT